MQNNGHNTREAKPLPGSLFQYVFDSSSLIEIERRRYIRHLRILRDFMILPEKVAKEVSQPGTPLKRFLDRYLGIVIRLRPEEERRYLEIRRQPGIHDPDAEAIALALSCRHPLVIEDKKARSKAENHGIKCLRWHELLGTSRVYG